MTSVTITDIPKDIHVSGKISYKDFLIEAFGEEEIFDIDLRVTEYEDLTKEEQKELDHIASLDDSRFINI